MSSSKLSKPSNINDAPALNEDVLEKISNLQTANKLLESALAKAGKDLQYNQTKIKSFQEIIDEKDSLLMEMQSQLSLFKEREMEIKSQLESNLKFTETLRKENAMWREKWNDLQSKKKNDINTENSATQSLVQKHDAPQRRGSSLNKEPSDSQEKPPSLIPKPSSCGRPLLVESQLDVNCKKIHHSTRTSSNKGSPTDSTQLSPHSPNNGSQISTGTTSWWGCAQALLQTPATFDSGWELPKVIEGLESLDKKCRSYFLELIRKSPEKVYRSLQHTHPQFSEQLNSNLLGTGPGLSKSQLIGLLHDGFFNLAIKTMYSFGIQQQYTKDLSNTHPSIYGLHLLSQQTYFRESYLRVFNSPDTPSSSFNVVKDTSFFTKDLSQLHRSLSNLFFDDKLKPKWHRIMQDCVLIHYRLKGTHPRLEWLLPKAGSIATEYEMESKFEENSPIVQCCYKPGIFFPESPISSSKSDVELSKNVKIVSPIVFT